MAIATTNPATGEIEKTFEALSDTEVDERIARAAATAVEYRRTSFDDRARWMNDAADALEASCDEIARVMTTEMGKTIVAARAEVLKCAKGCRFYAQHAASMLADEPADAAAVGATHAYVRYEPLGPVLAVMPWNFPLWQVIRFAAPALMAGNVGLLKHASNVPQTALLIEDTFRSAGFPDGAFQTLLIGASSVERILRDPRVRAATLTGSTPAGRSIGRTAGEELKPVVLELGGSDPFVVMPSADIEKAAQTAVTARVQNNGQSCIAAKRFIVHDDVADAFEERFVARMQALRVGDPMDEQTDIGPLASEQGLLDVESFMADAVERGARVLCGGRRLEGRGWFYPPTVVTDLTPEMRMYHEEIFGPVAQLFRVRDADAAIGLANATVFGLGSNVWTRDESEQARFVRALDAGAVFVNGMTTSYPELPFGGVKESGFGRELSSQGIRAFCNVKTVWVG
ncbi:MAG: succinate-semialdehyde dehydrogenase / glutarate-semialdehyde dehydrogenase [Actinomycetota bacterium]|jgi:succinate-semialdehyde dehydrogenase/glutarate-semialdehyde dehydrogenase|nr:succinate-semialdehyde dehydrogenase / glutarate-semialdehyde dehydrogenase [Actinomycetota bacterium]